MALIESILLQYYLYMYYKKNFEKAETFLAFGKSTWKSWLKHTHMI